jgi:hypothetical protein
VRVFTQERRGANDNIDTIHTRLDGESGIVHVTSNMCQNLGSLETELADGFTVRPRLGRGRGRGQLNVLDSKVVEPKVQSASELFSREPVDKGWATGGGCW